MIARGLSKAQLGDVPGAIRDYEKLVNRFDGSKLPEIRARIASTLINKGFAWRRLDDPIREIESYDDLIKRFDASDELGLRTSVTMALSCKSMAQGEIGLADEALAVCQKLERRIHGLSVDGDGHTVEASWVDWCQWRTSGARALALAVQNDHRASMDEFRAAYAAFPPNNEVTIHEMLRLVPALVAAGAPLQDLLHVLASDMVKSSGLYPLISALQERAGSPMSAPREVREVAIDIHRLFDEAKERLERFTG